jgi:hypothetical protein
MNASDPRRETGRKTTSAGLSLHLSHITAPVFDVQARLHHQSTVRLSIGDGVQVSKQYLRCFKGLQQNACKVILKVFVKAIEPKKQTNHPYSGGSARPPFWWPPRPPGGEHGAAKQGFVRHKEPDHLLKGGENRRVTSFVIEMPRH